MNAPTKFPQADAAMSCPKCEATPLELYSGRCGCCDAIVDHAAHEAGVLASFIGWSAERPLTVIDYTRGGISL